MSQHPDWRPPTQRDSDRQTPLRRGVGRVPTSRIRGSGRGEAVRSGGSGRVTRSASQVEVNPPPEKPNASLLETPGGTVEIHNGEFNAIGGHHISVTINTGGDGLHSNPVNSAPTVQPNNDENFVEEAGQRLGSRRPPTPPAQRSCDIYYRHMGTQRRGSPLWIPEPNKNLPLQYQRQGITIGDVGIITAFGSFAFLFSICLPHDHPVQPAELPENFEPFCIAQSDIEKQSEFKNDSYLASASIERSRHDGDSSGLIFESSASEGAILTMPVGSNSEDLGNLIRLRRYVAAHAASWYKYVYDVRGREVLNGDVRLVIGYDKTKAWGMATFANATAQRDAFRLKFMSMQQSNVGKTYGWEYSGMAHVRAGPDTREIEALRAGDPSEEGSEYENQCLFVRTMNVTLLDKIWKELASELDIQVDLDARNSNANSLDSSMQGLPRSGYSSANSSTFSPSTYGGIPTTSRTAENNVVRGYSAPSVHVSDAAMAGHPSKAINKMLLKNSSASVRVAITEDKDWTSVLTQDDFVLPSAEDLCARVRASSIIREEDGVIFLEPKEIRQQALTELPKTVEHKPFQRPPCATSTPASLMTLDHELDSTSGESGRLESASTSGFSLLDWFPLDEPALSPHLAASVNPGAPSERLARHRDPVSRGGIKPRSKPLLPGSFPTPASRRVSSSMSLGIEAGPALHDRKTTSKAAEQKRRDALKTSFDELRKFLPPISPSLTSLSAEFEVEPALYRKTTGTGKVVAEQKRRDSLKNSFDDLRKLLPPIPQPTDTDLDPLLFYGAPLRVPVPKTGGEGLNEGVSKLQLLRSANEYIQELKESVESRDDEISRLRREVGRLSSVVEERGGMDTEEGGCEEFDLEKDLDAVEKGNSSGSGWAWGIPDKTEAATDGGDVEVSDVPMGTIVGGDLDDPMGGFGGE